MSIQLELTNEQLFLLDRAVNYYYIELLAKYDKFKHLDYYSMKFEEEVDRFEPLYNKLKDVLQKEDNFTKIMLSDEASINANISFEAYDAFSCIALHTDFSSEELVQKFIHDLLKAINGDFSLGCRFLKRWFKIIEDSSVPF